MKARVNTFLNIRTGTPEILPDNNPDDAFLRPNDIVEIVDTVIGQEYKENDVWHRLDTGVFISNVGVDVDKNLFFKTNTPASTTNDLSNKIILNNPVGKNGRGITIGILDSGVDTGHPALKAALESEENFMTDPAENTITNNHGTNIAGLLVGNDERITGLTIDARLKSFRVIKNSNSVDEFALQKALDHILANEENLDILNLSLEVIESSFPFFLDAFNAIIKKNILLVVAGNINNSTALNALAGLENVIVVGTFESADFAHIPAAIQVAFLNAQILTTNLFGSDEKYSLFGDTSAYTAIVTGIIGKFLSNQFINKNDRYKEVMNYLKLCSFNIEADELPFKIYRNVIN